MNTSLGNFENLEVELDGESMLLECVLEGMEREGMCAEKDCMLRPGFTERVNRFYLPCLLRVAEHIAEIQKAVREENKALRERMKKK